VKKDGETRWQKNMVKKPACLVFRGKVPASFSHQMLKKSTRKGRLSGKIDKKYDTSVDLMQGGRRTRQQVKCSNSKTLPNREEKWACTITEQTGTNCKKPQGSSN